MKNKIILGAVAAALLLLTSCTTTAVVTYTDQTARALYEGAAKIAEGIVVAAIIRGILNK